MRTWLKNIREEKGYSQNQFSKLISVTYQYYNFIENGRRRPSIEVAKEIAEVLGFDWNRFFEE